MIGGCLPFYMYSIVSGLLVVLKVILSVTNIFDNYYKKESENFFINLFITKMSLHESETVKKIGVGIMTVVNLLFIGLFCIPLYFICFIPSDIIGWIVAIGGIVLQMVVSTKIEELLLDNVLEPAYSTVSDITDSVGGITDSVGDITSNINIGEIIG